MYVPPRPEERTWGSRPAHPLHERKSTQSGIEYVYIYSSGSIFGYLENKQTLHFYQFPSIPLP